MKKILLTAAILGVGFYGATQLFSFATEDSKSLKSLKADSLHLVKKIGIYKSLGHSYQDIIGTETLKSVSNGVYGSKNLAIGDQIQLSKNTEVTLKVKTCANKKEGFELEMINKVESESFKFDSCIDKVIK